MMRNKRIAALVMALVLMLTALPMAGLAEGTDKVKLYYYGWTDEESYRLTAEQCSCSGEKSKSWSERSKRLAMILFNGVWPLFSCGRGSIIWLYRKSDTHTIAPTTKRYSFNSQTMPNDEIADRMDMAMSGQVILVIENDA